MNREYQRAWAKRHREVQKEYRRKLRQRVITKMGGKCVNCGCDIQDALEINHKNGGGRKEYGGSGAGDYQKHMLFAILNGTRSMDDLELRCKVCNALHYVTMIKKLPGKWRVKWRP
jgi:5-methylcytosine-specific restriction endonuclease McrA